MGIVSPMEGGTAVGPDVTVEVEVFDFTLVPPTGVNENPGEGHIIYYLDLEPAFVPGQPAIPTDPEAIYAASDQLTHTFEDVAPGPHFVTVLLVHDNHTPVFPPVIGQVSFTAVAPLAETPTASLSPTPNQPTPVITQLALSSSIEPMGSPTAAVLPAVGSTQADSTGGTSAWPLAAAAGGFIGLVAGSAVILLQRLRR